MLWQSRIFIFFMELSIHHYIPITSPIIKVRDRAMAIRSFLRALLSMSGPVFLSWQCRSVMKPEAHRPQRSPECTAIQPKYCKNCMQEKLTFHLPWQLIKFSSLGLIHLVVRGLLKEHYCKAFVKIPKVG